MNRNPQRASFYYRGARVAIDDEQAEQLTGDARRFRGLPTYRVKDLDRIQPRFSNPSAMLIRAALYITKRTRTPNELWSHK